VNEGVERETENSWFPFAVQHEVHVNWNCGVVPYVQEDQWLLGEDNEGCVNKFEVLGKHKNIHPEGIATSCPVKTSYIAEHASIVPAFDVVGHHVKRHSDEHHETQNGKYHVVNEGRVF